MTPPSHSQAELTNCLFQVLSADLIPFLLRLLEGEGMQTVPNAAQTKAQIVKSLKAMMGSLEHGEQVSMFFASEIGGWEIRSGMCSHSRYPWTL